MTLERRSLKFDSFDEVRADVDNLLKGYTKVGKWDLAQCCGHLAVWAGYPVEGYPRGNFLVRTMLSAIKMTMGRQMREHWLTTGQMKSGIQTMPETVPAPGMDEVKAAEMLKQKIQQFEAYTGEYQASPLLGAMTREEARKIQLVHMGHHLSFLIPKS